MAFGDCRLLLVGVSCWTLLVGCCLEFVDLFVCCCLSLFVCCCLVIVARFVLCSLCVLVIDIVWL